MSFLRRTQAAGEADRHSQSGSTRQADGDNRKRSDPDDDDDVDDQSGSDEDVEEEEMEFIIVRDEFPDDEEEVDQRLLGKNTYKSSSLKAPVAGHLGSSSNNEGSESVSHRSVVLFALETELTRSEKIFIVLSRPTARKFAPKTIHCTTITTRSIVRYRSLLSNCARRV